MKMTLLMVSLAILLPLAACTQPQQAACVVDCHPWKCVEENARVEMCTMIYKVGTECYARHSTCTRQADGQCGWTPSANLQTCLTDAEANLPTNGGGE